MKGSNTPADGSTAPQPHGSAPRGALADRLRAFREQHGLTQEELARALGVSWSTLARWEGERQPPEHPQLLELALCELARRLKRRVRK